MNLRERYERDTRDVTIIGETLASADYAKHLESLLTWRSVKDELPKDEGMYETLRFDKFRWVKKWQISETLFINGVFSDTAVYWRPIGPLPPKPKEVDR